MTAFKAFWMAEFFTYLMLSNAKTFYMYVYYDLTFLARDWQRITPFLQAWFSIQIWCLKWYLWHLWLWSQLDLSGIITLDNLELHISLVWDWDRPLWIFLYSIVNCHLLYISQPLRLDIKRKLSARSDRVKCTDLHPSEPWMLASLYNGNVHVWNIESQVCTLNMSNLLVACFTAASAEHGPGDVGAIRPRQMLWLAPGRALDFG